VISPARAAPKQTRADRARPRSLGVAATLGEAAMEQAYSLTAIPVEHAFGALAAGERRAGTLHDSVPTAVGFMAMLAGAHSSYGLRAACASWNVPRK
jgi:hypothetical protein